ncbi:uncharacterized protein LOC111268933 isoform X2 [Varroa jacobsoni]|uniref:uncharacterized protein LOC111268933 isoform X2 n=1 Tax=Varroa jacobsoni TaxID=62625 RepID=UPI000BF318A6|nr:uncharacterized protein LOC111268933 isoform X2 [Varroa jacobsoni]
MKFVVGVLLFSVASSGLCDYEPDRSIRSILHNWMRVGHDLMSFENWICNNDEAVRTIAENLPPPSLGQLKAIDVNGLVCTYLTHSAIVNQVLRYFYASIAADASLTRPGYTIWNLFAQFVANRVKVLQAFNAAANSSPQEATRWTVRNEEALVDLKQAFLRSRRQLQGLQGFHW